MRPVRLLFVLFCAVASARADRAADLARIHIEAIGGKQRIEKLKALRASGTVTAAGRQVRFTLLAARPNKIRLETEAAGRTLVQGSDGDAAPWEFDTGTWPPKYRDMAAASAKTFAADAEFDDPLVAGAARGFTFDFAGEVEVGGRKLLRLLVTRNLTETYALLLDAQTYFIVKRIEQRTTTGGRAAQIVTHYEDFRPVDGVLLPHQVVVAIDGKVMQQTQIARIDANPKLADETFSRPKVSAGSAAKSGD